MDKTHQEPDLAVMFKAARRTRDRGNLEDALRLYKVIGDKNPYYPGLDIQVRALEMEMTRGFGHPAQRAEVASQPVPITHSHTAQRSRRASRRTNPYVLYGIITFLPAIMLTLILARVVFPNSNMLVMWLIVINVIAFFVYGYDKIIAPSGIVRVPEAILLAQVVSGAFVLAPIARLAFRHKTQKVSFRIKFWIAEIVCVAWLALHLILTFWLEGL
jgi:uncharacterized membrane protein YsdA (DUF1294 family)